MGAARENAKTLCDTNCTGNCNIQEGRKHCAGWPCTQPQSQSTCNVTGLKYAWESATTGYAACPACCTVNELEEIHISGDVSLAMWQTWQASHDLEWLKRVGWAVIKGGKSHTVRHGLEIAVGIDDIRAWVCLCDSVFTVAEFWVSRLTLLPGGGVALINAGGPDEGNSHATDNSYDLGSALHSIQHALTAAKIVSEHVPSQWNEILEAIPAAFSFADDAEKRRMLRCWGGGVKNACNGRISSF